jgi:hypothetical protein
MSKDVQAAFVEAAGVPPNDKLQIFRPRDGGEIVFDPTCGGVDPLGRAFALPLARAFDRLPSHLRRSRSRRAMTASRF